MTTRWGGTARAPPSVKYSQTTGQAAAVFETVLRDLTPTGEVSEATNLAYAAREAQQVMMQAAEGT
jgi:hypothetical protein